MLLMMKEVEGYSIQELARLFRCNQNTVKVKLFRARRRLAQIARKKLPKKNRVGAPCEITSAIE